MLRDRPPPITFLLNHFGPMSSFTWEPSKLLWICIFGAVTKVRTMEENYSLGCHSETHAKLVMKLFEAASWFCLTREESILTPDCCSEWLHSLLVACDLYSLFDQSQVWTDAYTEHIWRSWYNCSCTMMAKPIKTLELHYPMIHFFYNKAYYFYF